MPSKGTPFRTFRLPEALAVEIETTIARRNVHSANPPWSFSGFILAALREKLDKMERSRTQGGRKRRPGPHLKNAAQWQENLDALASAGYAISGDVLGGLVDEPAHLEDITDEAIDAQARAQQLVCKHRWQKLLPIPGSTILYLCQLCDAELDHVPGEQSS